MGGQAERSQWKYAAGTTSLPALCGRKWCLAARLFRSANHKHIDGEGIRNMYARRVQVVIGPISVCRSGVQEREGTKEVRRAPGQESR